MVGNLIRHHSMMASSLLRLSVLLTAAYLADAVNIDVISAILQQNSKGIFEKMENETPPCSEMAPSSPSASVHTLRPADIDVFAAMGVPASKSPVTSRVISRAADLLSLFNADVIALPLDLAVQHKNLLEEAEDLSSSLSSYQDTDWKFVLLFVPVDSLCACSMQAAQEVDAAVEEVEAALEVLQEKLHHTLVHTVVWSGRTMQENFCQCTTDNNISQRLQHAVHIKTLQDSLMRALAKYIEREDFAVALQSTPIIFHPTTDSAETHFDQLAFQLLENMLHLKLTGEAKVMENDASTTPCYTELPIYLRTQKNSPTEETESLYGNASLTDPVMGTEMTCVDHNPSLATPTSVHELRPGDIRVVAAVGDSLTAANGVGARTDNIFLLTSEYRGLSWSIGGDASLANVTTLPNILKEFNPMLTGFSEGIGDENSPQAFLNQAVPGAKCGNMARQVRTLVDKMKTDMRIDFQNDWKVITMFIGGNDICDFCTDTIHFSPRNMVGRIRDALDLLHKEVPRAIVNLVELLHMVPLRDLHSEKSLRCPTFLVKVICPCVLLPTEGSAELQRLRDFNRAYQRAMRELVDSGRYDQHDNFTVVLQPFFREVTLPRLEDGHPDRSFFTPDCFHMSQKAHTLMARALWNNMIEPVGNKTFTQDFTAGIDLKCPSKEMPFFRTAQNSNYSYPEPSPNPPPVTNWGSDFTCVDTAPSHSVPTSVHRLRPGDINVVAALGDSLTAGLGAKSKNILQLFTEYRGVSWSIGGDKTLDTITTLPNILKKFNAKIKGMSKGQGKRQTGFNMAVTGAKVSGVPGQVRQLIEVMKNNSAVSFEKDWKLVTLFIGVNDLCQYCYDRASLSPKNYSHYLKTSLDILYKEVPRVMINVVEVLELEFLRRIKKDGAVCSFIQKQACRCFLEPSDDSPQLAEVKRINRDYQRETEDLVYGGQYDGREDFTVVLQPFLRNTILPLTSEGRPDASYTAMDCFHFSERGHAGMATGLWNNMFEPVGKKQTYNNYRSDRNTIKCPAEHPYIFTRANSNSILTTTTPAPSPSQTTTTPAPGPSPTTAVPLDPTCGVPAWAVAVLPATGLFIGCALTWLLLACRQRSNHRKMRTGVEMKGTEF